MQISIDIQIKRDWFSSKKKKKIAFTFIFEGLQIES